MDNEQPKLFFDYLDEIKKQLSQKEIIVFLDYDGTLTPIVERPELAVISEEMKGTVLRLSEIFTVSIVSGRATDDVKGKVGLENLFYAGSHGFEIIYPNGKLKLNDEAQKIRPIIDEAYKKLSSSLSSVKGAFVEHVKYTLSTHYRLAADKDVPLVEKIVDDLLKEYPMLRKTHGKKVFEIRPRIDWDKGKAVDWILNDISSTPQEKLFPIYIGDDITDEDVFRILKDRGLGIVVLDSVRASEARYKVSQPKDVQKVLEFLISLRSEK